MRETMSREAAEELTQRIRDSFAEVTRLEAELAKIQPAWKHKKSKAPDTRAVYFIVARDTGKVKIGVAADPLNRLAQLATASPSPLYLAAIIPGIGQPGEKALHAKLADARSHGEWFHPTPEVLAELTAAQVAP